MFSFWGAAFGLYSPMHVERGFKEVGQVWMSWFASVPAVVILLFVFKMSEDVSRAVTLFWFMLVPTVITLYRGVSRRVVGKIRSKGKNSRRVAIAGATEIGVLLAQRISEQPWLGLSFQGFYDDRAQSRLVDIPNSYGAIKGSLADLIEQAHLGHIEHVYVALPLKAEGRIQQLIRKLSDTTVSVYIVPDFFAYDLMRSKLTMLGDVPLLSIFDTPFYGVDGWLKRVEDVFVGGICLLIALPIMGVIAVAIKLTSKGPVFFHQRRYGLHGQVIDILKFRSMTVTEDGAKVTQATMNDSRVTPLGKILRRFSLDELPQLFHVVSGTMSLVGPRPHAVAHNERYRKVVKKYMLRHKVKPGITGWAQVNGWRGETDTNEKMEKRVEFDLDYIRRWSISMDLWIVFLTLFGRKVRKNAY